jgi:TolB-like protein/Tfp pilus assembly protein PilF
MGEVYRARDPRLQRDVAIKILPDELTAHADRRARFEREARMLASVNHPNIGAIYGLEDSGGELGLVLELVDGPTLAERLLSGAVPAKAALAMGTQIAAALEAAHELGIVHRDLKPQNIKLKPDGSVKVLDFGLAKTLERGGDVRDGSLPPTVMGTDLTREGTVLGTPAYMSPEQMHGRAIDKRADAWAFGCVLYELLTGRRAFGGDDLPGTTAAVLKSEPDWSLLPADVPAFVRTLLSRCLEKDAARRLRDIGDVRIMLEDASTQSGPAFNPVHAHAPAPSTRPRRATALAAAGGVIVVLGAAVGLYLQSDRATPVDAATAAPVAAEPAAEGAPRDPAATQRLPNSIAVLPLDNLSADPNDAYLAAGLHEEILTQLGKLHSVSPISRTSVLRYAENPPSIPEIARDLRVDAVMEGSVRSAGTEITVTARLVDPDTALHVWVGDFKADRNSADQVYALSVDIATGIAGALGAEITADDRARIDRAPTASAAAYTLYLRARDRTFNYRFAEAVQDLDEAIRLDENFADAYAQRAYLFAYGQVTSNSRLQILREERYRNADFEALCLRDAEQALKLDPRTGLAWVALALTHDFHFRAREAREAFARALEASPNDANILAEYAMKQHLRRGELDEALSMVRLAESFDPNGLTTLTYVAQIAQAAGRNGEANDALARALVLDPSSLEANLWAGLFSADAAGGKQHLSTVEELAARQAPFYFLGIGWGYQRLGLDSDAKRALDRYSEWGRTQPLGDGEWAYYYLALGDMDQVYARLQRVVAKVENGEADAGFIPLQRVIYSTDPRLSQERFRPLIARLRAGVAD